MSIVEIFPLIFVGLLIAYFAYRHVKLKWRREAMGALAADMGWEFVPDRSHYYAHQFDQFDFFRRGDSRRAYNTLLGSISIHGTPWTVKMGDFSYTEYSKRGITRRRSGFGITNRFSYLIVVLPYKDVPDLLVRRERMFDSVKSWFGVDDIDFESAEFSRTFFVKSRDERFARDVVHNGMIEFLLASDPRTVDIEQGYCCLSDGKRLWKPEQFCATIDWIQQFFTLWPGQVLGQLEPSAVANQDS